MVTSIREAVLAKWAHARAALRELRQARQARPTAMEWQNGYVKALEEILELDGLSLRRYPRRSVTIRTKIARVLPEPRTPEEQREGTITDLSVGGCGLATAIELSVGELIRLSVRFPQGRRIVTLDGWVRRFEVVGAGLQAGVEFKELPERIAGALQAFLRRSTESG